MVLCGVVGFSSAAPAWLLLLWDKEKQRGWVAASGRVGVASRIIANSGDNGTVNTDGADGMGDKWTGLTSCNLRCACVLLRQFITMSVIAKINPLCSFGNYNYHFGVIYLLYNVDRAICSSF